LASERPQRAASTSRSTIPTRCSLKLLSIE
jgi:hypothetical protein